jgi:hypothetical protein
MLLSQPSDGLEKRQSEVARTPKRVQKEDGARRSMWGEEGNDVRLNKLSHCGSLGHSCQ